MIRNLNQVTFQGFGSVLPERAQSSKNSIAGLEQQVSLDVEKAKLYRTVDETSVICSSGTSVLSVSADGGNFQAFYLDKPVSLKKGIYFMLCALQGDASAVLKAPQLPEELGSRDSSEMRMGHRLRVEGVYTFFYQEKEQGFLFSGESHPMWELTYVDQGELHSVVDGQDLLLRKGDVVIYGPGQWHMQYADIGVAPRFVTISFDMSGSDLEVLLNRKYSAPQQVVMLLQQMLREQERMLAFHEDIILSQLNLLLLQMMRESISPTGGKIQGVNVIHSENEIIRQAQQYISEHIREKLSVPLVAQQVDVSPSYLTVLFHKNMQISPGEYIRRTKLQESKQMIRENNLNFTEIAAALQYSTVHHFSRQFKEKFGITPTEYAKSVR